MNIKEKLSLAILDADRRFNYSIRLISRVNGKDTYRLQCSIPESLDDFIEDYEDFREDAEFELERRRADFRAHYILKALGISDE